MSSWIECPNCGLDIPIFLEENNPISGNITISCPGCKKEIPLKKKE